MAWCTWLRGCMEAVKALLDKILVDAGGTVSCALLEASPEEFWGWLEHELALVPTMFDNAADFGAFGGVLTVACALRASTTKSWRGLMSPSLLWRRCGNRNQTCPA